MRAVSESYSQLRNNLRNTTSGSGHDKTQTNRR